MLVWDETDVLTVLEVIPDIGQDAIWHKYSVKILLYQYDGDVQFELFREGVEKSIYSMKIIDCPGAIRKVDTTGEYLEFAESKCFGSRYDGNSSIPFGVRIYIKPSISISLF